MADAAFSSSEPPAPAVGWPAITAHRRCRALVASLGAAVMLGLSGCTTGGGATAPAPTDTETDQGAFPTGTPLATPTFPEELPTEVPTGSPTGRPSELEVFRARCEQGIQDWKVSAGQADYPKTLVLTVGQPSTYNAAIDISAAPVPPDDVITVPSGQAGSEPIFVKCAVAARLVPVGELTVSPGSDEWVTRSFSPAGVAEWAWTVSTGTSSAKQLRLQLQPAALGNGVPLAGGDQTAELVTEVSVEATAIDSASDWMTTQWPKLVGVIAALGLALLGLLRWKGWPMLTRLAGRGQAAPPTAASVTSPHQDDATAVAVKTGPTGQSPRDPSTTSAPGRKRPASKKAVKRS